LQTHKWVNAESMLEKCFIGPLKRDSVVKMKPRTGMFNYLGLIPYCSQGVPLSPRTGDTLSKTERRRSKEII